jgi:hypothetical protein
MGLFIYSLIITDAPPLGVAERAVIEAGRGHQLHQGGYTKSLSYVHSSEEEAQNIYCVESLLIWISSPWRFKCARGCQFKRRLQAESPQRSSLPLPLLRAPPSGGLATRRKAKEGRQRKSSFDMTLWRRHRKILSRLAQRPLTERRFAT